MLCYVTALQSIQLFVISYACKAVSNLVPREKYLGTRLSCVMCGVGAFFMDCGFYMPIQIAQICKNLINNLGSSSEYH